RSGPGQSHPGIQGQLGHNSPGSSGTRPA
ncbi:uncharacterized protein METZ01_LOCUS169157, partial [marine metagenome]